MKYIDFHTHIDFYDDPVSIANEYEKNDIYTLFVTNLPEIFKKHLFDFESRENIRLAIGYHPELVGQYDFNYDVFNKYVEYTNYIGEVGLDFSKGNIRTKNEQIEIFRYITQKKFTSTRIVSIHSRNAEKEVLNILEDNNVKYAVFHWYTGSLKLAKEIAQKGYYFSINSNMITTEKGIKLIKEIPIDKILIETDGPFTKWDKEIIRPERLKFVYKNLEELLEVQDIKEIIYMNFRNLILSRHLIEFEENNK